MAIPSLSFVAAHRISTEFARGYQGQPPRFGIIYAEPGVADADVLWSDGQLVLNVNQAQLDMIIPIDLDLPESLPNWIGKVVEVAINPTATFRASSAYDATVISVYYRSQNGLSDPRIGPIGLCKLLNGTEYIETLLSNLTALDNR